MVLELCIVTIVELTLFKIKNPQVDSSVRIFNCIGYASIVLLHSGIEFA